MAANIFLYNERHLKWHKLLCKFGGLYCERVTRFMDMDLKYCRRTELIELIETQRRTIEELKAENEALKNAAETPKMAMTPAAETYEEKAIEEEKVALRENTACEEKAALMETPGALRVILERLDTLKSADAVRISELERENAALRAQLDERLRCGGEIGNLAEAALSMNGVFESAQRAAEQYLQKVKSARGDAEGILREATAQAERIVQAAQTAAQAREQATDESIRVREEDFKRRCEGVIQNYEALKVLFEKMK